jgi:hypothetical protein
MKYVLAGVEDVLSRAVLIRLIGEHPSELGIANIITPGGWGHLRKRVLPFAKASARNPAILLTDLDDRPCAPGMVAEWRKDLTFDAPDLLIRVAEKEIESWVLADHVGARGFLGQPQLIIPPNTDDIADPKAWMLNASRRGPRSLRDGFLRQEGNKLLPGLEYNPRLVSFVAQLWNPEAASANSPSLQRARRAIASLTTG